MLSAIQPKPHKNNNVHWYVPIPILSMVRSRGVRASGSSEKLRSPGSDIEKLRDGREGQTPDVGREAEAMFAIHGRFAEIGRAHV